MTACPADVQRGNGRRVASAAAASTGARLSTFGHAPLLDGGLLLTGRLMLAQQNNATAVGVLRRATELNPMPEFQWALAEALRPEIQRRDAYRIEGRAVDLWRYFSSHALASI